MTETLFLLVANYGAGALFAVTFLSCLAVPVPASLVMLTGGAFAAAGDLVLATAALSAYAGAVGGDQVGYFLGRRGAPWLEQWTAARPVRRRLLVRARYAIERWGGVGVFLSRWLVSPLGPYVNFAGGAARMAWVRFSVWGMAGEAIWVGLYVGLGYGFATNLVAVAEIAADVSGFMAGAVVTVGLGVLLRAVHRRRSQKAKARPRA